MNFCQLINDILQRLAQAACILIMLPMPRQQEHNSWAPRQPMTNLMHAGACDVKHVCCKWYETSTDMETRPLCLNSQWLINVEQISQWSIRVNETRFLLSDQSIEGAEEEIYYVYSRCRLYGCE